MARLRTLARLLLLAFVAVLAFLLARGLYRSDDREPEVSATVMLERITPVLKLITVEGEFNELYSHRDQWTWKYGIPGLTEKKALLRVRARVSVGYDLEGMRVSLDEQNRTITLLAPPDPKVLSMEHDVDYYDITEGLFNSFSPSELSDLQAKAKQRILDKVPQSGLFAEAARQRSELVAVLRTLAESGGWTLREGYEPEDGRNRPER
jgi:hypothetical protein